MTKERKPEKIGFDGRLEAGQQFSGSVASDDNRRVDLPFALPPHAPDMRIGLFGGSFDPTHRGHVTASETARHRLGLDQVWWLITRGNPLKANAPTQSLTDRIATATAETKGRPIWIAGIETTIGSKYTVDTILWLRKRLPAVAMVWIMGADNLVDFHKWRGWRQLSAAVPFAVVDRPGATLAALSAPAARQLRRSQLPERLASELPTRRPPAWVFLHGPRLSLSSTEIRMVEKLAPT